MGYLFKGMSLSLCRKSGFILPYVLLLGGSFIIVGVLGIRAVQGEADRHRARARQVYRDSLLEANAVHLQKELTAQLTQPGSTALQAVADRPGHYTSVWVNPIGAPFNLYSTSTEVNTCAFTATDGTRRLTAEWAALTGPDAARTASVAWAIEDVGLTEQANIPSFWPFATLSLKAVPEPADMDLVDLTNWNSRELWIPSGEEIRFAPEEAPAMSPVLYAAGIRFSIFASGPPHSREKILRIRFILEGLLWNPYNRPMRLHAGSGTRPAFHIEFSGLPRVRVINVSRGIRSAWIDLCEVANDASGENGLHAWVDTPAIMERGGFLEWTAPRTSRQAEGLARTLHRGFLLGPADRVRLEFEPNSRIRVRATSVDESSAQESARAWAELESQTIDWPEWEFDRADDGNQPFFLPDGSLSFDRDKAYVLLWMQGEWDPQQPTSDPRLQQPDAAGNWVDRSETSLLDLRDKPFTTETPDPVALFSWPTEQPDTLRPTTDLPGTQNGWQIGWPDNEENEILQTLEAWQPWHPEDQHPPPEETNWPQYLRCQPINAIDAILWENTLLRSARPHSQGYAYPQFATINPETAEDFALLDPLTIRSGAQALGRLAEETPMGSVADFFREGRAFAAFPDLDSRLPAHRNLPFKGFFRDGPALVNRSSVYVLHIAVRVQEGNAQTQRARRYWLLETSVNPSELTLIHVETTHLPTDYP